MKKKDYVLIIILCVICGGICLYCIFSTPFMHGCIDLAKMKVEAARAEPSETEETVTVEDLPAVPVFHLELPSGGTIEYHTRTQWILSPIETFAVISYPPETDLSACGLKWEEMTRDDSGSVNSLLEAISKYLEWNQQDPIPEDYLRSDWSGMLFYERQRGDLSCYIIFDQEYHRLLMISSTYTDLVEDSN